jgi:hypothetical protein
MQYTIKHVICVLYNLIFCPGVFLGRSKKKPKESSIRSVSDRDLNPKLPEYEAGVLAT